MKLTNRHSGIWNQMDRLLTAPDRNREYYQNREKSQSLDRTDRDLKNAYRL